MMYLNNLNDNILSKEYVNILKIILSAGKLIKKQTQIKIEEKSAMNYVTSTDLNTEAFIVKKIKKLYPDAQFLSEESYNQINNEIWILDPLDGTTNYIHRYLHFGISLARVINNNVVFACIYDVMNNELFCAEDGKGAYLNGGKISVSKNNKLNQSMISIGVPYDKTKTDIIFDKANKISKLCQDIKRKGPASIDIAYVACGRIEAYFELNLKPWDFAAGKLILEESGGIITTWDNKPLNILKENSILASNKSVHLLVSKILY